MKRLALVGLLIALALLALIGVLSVTRGTPVEYVVSRDDPTGPPSPHDSLFARTIELYAGTTLHGGNRVQVLENGEGTYPLLWRDLRTCEHTVTVQMYFAQPGVVADTMSAVLRECAQKGARVLVLLDGFGAQTLAEQWVAPLRRVGIRVAWLRQLRWYTLHKAAERSHARVVVVDGRVGYTGGFGLADYWLGNGRKPEEWRETNVRFEGPTVAQLQAAFGSTWAEATGELLTGDAFFPRVALQSVADRDSVSPTGVQRARRRSGPGRGASAEAPPPGDAPVDARAATDRTVRAGLFHAVPSTGSTPAERFLALTIAGARRTLYITNAYFVPDDDFRRLLIQAAKRGVDVRIMTTGPETDVKSTLWAGRFRYEDLLRSGVRVYEYQPANMHAKTISVDGVWGSVGSMNFDNRSLAFNDETTLLVQDSVVVGGMDRMFLEDLRFSKEVTAAEMAGRPWWQKVRDAGAATLQRVL
ncbi:cardiolipin synthase B [Roseisolibacter sp. H3M3-2]|uniref:phospholipase D-like domain-containing protein n=1 Tax=Roseisolibacter sp. H3M3-2 TaxID=3031323 RepID=UPI0023DC86F2|nr:cardiolipin synthase B [Roseisolibacter sp. H3M3-2]